MPINILVVDDSEVISTSIHSVKPDCHIDRSDDVKSSLRMIQAAQKKGHPYHLIFVEYYLFPDRGSRIIRRIRSIEKSMKQNKHYIIACCPVFATGLPKKLIHMGANEVLQTPIEYSELQNCLKDITFKTLAS